MNKQTIIENLRAFINQRPGLDYGNYGDPVAYRAEYRGILKDYHHAHTLLSSIEWRDSITADDIIRASQLAFAGRLSIDPETGAIDYCTGQYFPTEYRAAACAVLASVFREYFRKRISGILQEKFSNDYRR